MGDGAGGQSGEGAAAASVQGEGPGPFPTAHPTHHQEPGRQGRLLAPRYIHATHDTHDTQHTTRTTHALSAALVCGLAQTFRQTGNPQQAPKRDHRADRGAEGDHPDGVQIIEESRYVRERVLLAIGARPWSTLLSTQPFRHCAVCVVSCVPFCSDNQTGLRTTSTGSVSRSISSSPIRSSVLRTWPVRFCCFFNIIYLFIIILFAHLRTVAVMDNPFRKALVLFSKIRFQVHVKRVRSLRCLGRVRSCSCHACHVVCGFSPRTGQPSGHQL